MHSDEVDRLGRLACLATQAWAAQQPPPAVVVAWDRLLPREQDCYRTIAETIAKDIMEGDRTQLVEALVMNPGTSWGEAIEEVRRIYLLAWESLPKANADLAAANELVAKLSRMRDTPLQRISVAEGIARLAALGVTINLDEADRRGIACPQCMQPDCADPTHPGPEEVTPVGWCRECGEVDKCDEDRCCLSCGTDLIVFADRYSFELALEALGVAPEPAGAGAEGHES